VTEAALFFGGPRQAQCETSSVRSKLCFVASLGSFPTMMQRDRKRQGLRLCRAAWLIGVSVRRYRELEAGDVDPTPDE
jgi:hypothetical protein